MASSDNASIELPPLAPEDNTALTILADVTSQQATLSPHFGHQSLVAYTNPYTGKKGKALIISKDDTRLTPEFVAQFADVLAIDNDAKPLKNSQETVAIWTDDLRRKQAYRGRGYTYGILELGADEVREKADKAVKETQQRENVEKEDKEKKEKAEKEELERKKKMKKEAQNEEARKRKKAKKEAAGRRRNFQANIKADYDLDVDVTKAGDDK